jgi:hypothetical protein
MTRRTRVALTLGPAVALLALSVLSVPAWAQQFPTNDPQYAVPEPSLAPPEGFGSAGTIAITSDFDLDLRHLTDSFRGNSTSELQIQVSPSLLMFLARNFAVGGIFNYQFNRDDDGSPTFGEQSITTLEIGPLAAYNINVSPRASILPTVGLLYRYGKISQELMGGRQSGSGHDISLLLRAPVLFHAFPHVFVGATPFIEFDLSSKFEEMDVAKTRTFGVTLDLGFWF